jgi:hypothetical protein
MRAYDEQPLTMVTLAEKLTHGSLEMVERAASVCMHACLRACPPSDPA